MALMKGGDAMRKGLYMLRHDIHRHGKRLSQSEMAKKIGCSRATYSSIECGSRNGRVAFWKKLQRAFDIPDAELGGLMRNDNEETQAAEIDR